MGRSIIRLGALALEAVTVKQFLLADWYRR